MNAFESSRTATSLAVSVALVLEEIKNVKELHRSSPAKRLSFAIDVCLVAHGIRTGHLVDAVCSPDPMETFRTLLIALRRKSAVFEAVMFWHHAPSTQSFLVHTSLLQDKIAALLGGAAGTCVFVKLDRCPSAFRDLPDALREALRDLGLAMARSPNLPVLYMSEKLTGEILIPFAAVVIDYPVAYFPAFPTQTPFLEGVPLDIYAVTLERTSKASGYTLGGHVLLKFSCPQVLATNYAELSPGAMTKKLHDKFAAVLEPMGASISITHRTETLDRVAL